MTVRELIEILLLFKQDTEVMMSMDGIKCKEIVGADSVRKVRKGDVNGDIVETYFVAIE